MRNWTTFLAVLLTTGLAPPAAIGGSPAVEGFQPHRASYELLLIPGKGDGSVASAGGRLDFEWADVCDGWAVKQRTRVILGQSQGGELDFGWALTTWEAKDGLAFRFVIQRFQGGEVYETVRGDAELESQGGPGIARFEEPVAREVALPPGTLFPTDHTFRMIDSALTGNPSLYRLVFDASSETDGLAAVSAIVGGRIPSDHPATLDSDLIANLPSWRLMLAYFPPFGEAELPETEVDLRVFSNGLADDFRFNYGDFALRARLMELEPLAMPEC
ncbi:EipB family protein [Algihabitans albus]|uniref:EipB family protein n=1 Tax=Algihabitans albus TaxID=2164067 RepID=UPI001ABC80CC|nr:DUF1849 family protein [Algihabitans albus]